MNVNNIDTDVLFKINYYINQESNKNIKHPLNVHSDNIIIKTTKGIESINITTFVFSENKNTLIDFCHINFFDQLL